MDASHFESEVAGEREAKLALLADGIKASQVEGVQ